MTINCVGDVTVVGARTLNVDFGGEVTVTTPASVTVDTPETQVTGNLEVLGLLTYRAGMVGYGAGGGAATARIQGDIWVENGNIDVDNGDVHADTVTLKTHTHTQRTVPEVRRTPQRHKGALQPLQICKKLPFVVKNS